MMGTSLSSTTRWVSSHLSASTSGSGDAGESGIGMIRSSGGAEAAAARAQSQNRHVNQSISQRWPFLPADKVYNDEENVRMTDGAGRMQYWQRRCYSSAVTVIVGGIDFERMNICAGNTVGEIESSPRKCAKKAGRRIRERGIQCEPRKLYKRERWASKSERLQF